MKILKFLAQVLPCTAVFLLGQLSVSAQGLHYSPQELTAWRQRSSTGPYRVAGDAGANTPPDWTRINQYADDFRASPSDTGNTNNEALDIWTGYRFTIDSLNQYPYWQGIKMEAAGFKYLLFGDTAYGQAVRRTLLAQVRFEHPIHVGYNVANWPAPAGANKRPNYESGVPEALWLQRLVYSYDYTKNLYTSQERQEIEDYLQGGARYFSNIIHANFARCFPNRLQNDYSVKGYMAVPGGVPQWSSPIYATPTSARHQIWGDGYVYTHRNADGTLGNKITILSYNYNNRMFDKMAFIGMAGLLTGDSALIKNARQTVKEFIMYGSWPDGTYGEYERNGDYGNPNQGALLYGSKNLQAMVFLADAFARKGDYSLYNFSTTEGVHGTQVPTGGQPKSILSILTRYANVAVGSPALYYGTVAPLNRIDINNENTNTQFTINHVTWDYLLAIANKYYQSDYLKKVYTRQASVGGVPYPTKNLTSAGMVWLPWAGSGAEFPGVLFMFSQLENLKPFAVPCQTVQGAAVASIGSDSVILTYSPNLGALSGYRVEYKPTSATAWTAVRVTGTRYVLDNLAPATAYQVRVRSLCSTTDSSASSAAVSFTTLAAPCLPPTGFAAAPKAYDQIAVNAVLGNNGTALFIEYRALGATTWTQQLATSLPATIPNLTALTAYEVRTSSVCGVASSSPTASLTVTTPALPCGQGTNLTGTALAPDSALLTWNPGTGASQYQIRLRQTGTTNWKFVVVPQSRYKEGLLNPGTNYEFQVNTICPSGISGYTASKQFATPAAQVCDTVGQVAISNVSQTSATVAWQPAAGNTGGYLVRVRSVGATTWTQLQTTTTTVTINQLQPSTRLEVQVQNICGSNSASWSYTRTFATQALPCGVPTNVVAVPAGKDSMQVSWVGVAQTTGYGVQITERATGTVQNLLVGPTTTTLRAGGTRAGNTYDVAVVSYCAAGQSVASTASLSIALPCGIPTNVALVPAGRDSVRITWAGVSGSTGYSLQLTERGTTTTQNLRISAGTSSLKVGGLRPGSTYDVSLVSSCASGQSSAATASVTLTITATNGPLVAQAYSLAPNPSYGAAGRLYGPAGTVGVAIYDVRGQLVSQGYKEIHTDSPADLADLMPTTPGVYSLRATSTAGTYHTRLIRQ